MCKKEYINLQTKEVLDLERVTTLPDNAMLKVKPELWCNWDFEKNDELGFNIWKMKKGGHQLAWWICDKGHKHINIVKDKVKRFNGCPYCSGRYATENNNLLAKYPHLEKIWNYDKNTKFPSDYTPNSGQKVWWKCLDCGSEYDMVIIQKTNKKCGCPYCSGKRINHTNCLTTKDSKLASQWHPIKNGDLTSNDVALNYNKKVWWICDEGHEWETSPNSRVSNTSGNKGCPYCSNKKVLKGFNDMWTTNPELASLLLNPEDGYKYVESSNEKLDWKCADCGEICKGKISSNVKQRGVPCVKCNKGKSYPEKIIFKLLRDLNITYKNNITFDWLNNRRYDFYIPSLNMIIETHGKQHSNGGFSTLGGRSAEEEILNDKYKRETALVNGINMYIELDCKYSRFNYIKKSLLNSDLSILFNLNVINWDDFEKEFYKEYVYNIK